MSELEILLDALLVYDKASNSYVIPHHVYHDRLLPELRRLLTEREIHDTLVGTT